MIEVLIQYIRDKGFIVDIIPAFGSHPGVLKIQKRVSEEFCSVFWCIPKLDLRPDMEEILYYQVTKHMDMIDKAIAQKAGGKQP